MQNFLVEKIMQICNVEKFEVGYADLEGLLDPIWNNYRYGISIMRKLDDKIIDGIVNGPTEEYFDHYNEVNEELNFAAGQIANLLNNNGIEAVPIKATLDESDLDKNFSKTLKYTLSHKMVATRAGLGWIGRTDLLISKRFGPRIRMASVLTDKKISETGVPIEKSMCDNCCLCVKKCPVGASTGMTWKKGVEREEFYDAFKCRDYARKISGERINKEVSLCGICFSVCPVGRR